MLSPICLSAALLLGQPCKGASAPFLATFGSLAASVSIWLRCAFERSPIAGKPPRGDGPSQDPRSWAVPPRAVIPDYCCNRSLPAVVVAAAGALELICAMFVGCSGGSSILFPLSQFVRYVCCEDNAFLYGPA